MTFEEIQSDVAAWSAIQFPRNTPLEPLEGMFEEGGEIAHARLKGRQGIRHTREECEAMERDGIGDCGIYLCDFIARSGLDLASVVGWAGLQSAAPRSLNIGANEAFAQLAREIGILMRTYHSETFDAADAGSVLGALMYYAEVRGWDFLDILDETWAKVSRRDWQANPMNAATGDKA